MNIRETETAAMQMFAVVAKRWGGLFLVSEFSTQDRAEIALAENMDRHPLFVVPADVWFAPNGNVRLWKSAPGRAAGISNHSRGEQAMKNKPTNPINGSGFAEVRAKCREAIADLAYASPEQIARESANAMAFFASLAAQRPAATRPRSARLLPRLARRLDCWLQYTCRAVFSTQPTSGPDQAAQPLSAARRSPPR